MESCDNHKGSGKFVLKAMFVTGQFGTIFRNIWCRLKYDYLWWL